MRIEMIRVFFFIGRKLYGILFILERKIIEVKRENYKKKLFLRNFGILLVFFFFMVNFMFY